MKLLRLAFVLLILIVCNHVFGQNLMITSVGSKDRVPPMVLEKLLVGKRLELTLYKDSALVFIAPLHQTEKLKQISMNQYMRTDTIDKNISSSLLTGIEHRATYYLSILN